VATRILYIEDAKEQADALATILEYRLEGVEVQIARDGLEGIKKAREWDPDLILLDLMMPRLMALKSSTASDVMQRLAMCRSWSSRPGSELARSWDTSSKREAPTPFSPSH
jgi:CheY-like chemotaxis protein